MPLFSVYLLFVVCLGQEIAVELLLAGTSIHASVWLQTCRALPSSAIGSQVSTITYL